MSHMKSISRFGLPALSASLLVALLGVILSQPVPPRRRAIDAGKGPQLLIGRDDDKIDNVKFRLVRRRTSRSTAPTSSKAGRATT